MEHSSTFRPGSRNDFSVALVCALPREFDAVSLLFDELWDSHDDRYRRAPGDTNMYTPGRIGSHNVVLVLLPNMGKTSAAAAAAMLRTSYINLRLALLVGICGGIPIINGEEAVLGDVVIGKTVVQYDFGRQYTKSFVSKQTVDDELGRANKDIRNLVSSFETELGNQRLREKAVKHLERIQITALEKRRKANYQYPGATEDKLFLSDYDHRHREAYGICTTNTENICETASSASCNDIACDHGMLVLRRRLQPSLDAAENNIMCPTIFVGRIASGDRVIKSGAQRDRVAAAHNVIAFEMEGAGTWDEVPTRHLAS